MTLIINLEELNLLKYVGVLVLSLGESFSRLHIQKKKKTF